MRDDHALSIWKCRQCRIIKVDSAFVPSNQFSSKEAYLHHLSAEHSETVQQKDQHALADFSERRQPVDIESCLICGKDAKEIEGPDDQNTLAYSQMQDRIFRHMRHHLRCLALIALPWDDVTIHEREASVSDTDNALAGSGSREDSDTTESAPVLSSLTAASMSLDSDGLIETWLDDDFDNPPIRESTDSREWFNENVENYWLRREDLVEWLKRRFPKERYGRDDFNVQVRELSEKLLLWLTERRRGKINTCFNFHEG